MGLNVTSRLAKDWKVPQYDKLGVNFIEYWEYHPTMSYLKPYPDNSFTPYIEDAKKRGIKSFIEIGTAYTRVGDAVRGNMKKEIGTLNYPVKSYEEIKLEDIRAIDYTGKPVNMVCPSNRSRYYQKTLDHIPAPRPFKTQCITCRSQFIHLAPFQKFRNIFHFFFDRGNFHDDRKGVDSYIFSEQHLFHTGQYGGEFIRLSGSAPRTEQIYFSSDFKHRRDQQKYQYFSYHNSLILRRTTPDHNIFSFSS